MTGPAKVPELPAIPRVVDRFETYDDLLAQIPPFPDGVLTYEWYQKLLPMLAAPLEQDAVQVGDTEREKGYKTVGYGYQYCVNRFNEVLPGHWRYAFTTIGERQKQVGEKRRDWWDIDISVTVQIGNWKDGAFVPLDEKTCPGGHGSMTRADALKGALTNAFKKTAAMFGVGKQAYEGVLDEDNQSSGLSDDSATGGNTASPQGQRPQTQPQSGSSPSRPNGQSAPSGTQTRPQQRWSQGPTQAQGTRGTTAPQGQPRQQGAARQGGPSAGSQPSRSAAPQTGAGGQRATSGPQGGSQPRQSAGSRQPSQTQQSQPRQQGGSRQWDDGYEPPPEDDQGYEVPPDTGEPGNDPPKEIDLSTWKGDCAYTAILEEEPRTGTTSRGDAYTAVKVILFENDCEVVIRAFGDLAGVLAQYGRGEAIAITGKAQVVNDKPGIKCETVGLAQDAA